MPTLLSASLNGGVFSSSPTAGLRVSEIKRLDWSQVDLAGGYVHVSAKKSKTWSRCIVPILDALRAWITPIAKTSAPIIQPNFRRRSTAVREAAEIKDWPDNGMRHSFVSYRLADTGNAAQTALESGHGQAILFSNYREIMKPKDTQRYFSIHPAVKE
jgi:integrase